MTVDPQQFNLYSYVRNNPLRFLDPSGERLFAFGSGALDELHKGAGGQDTFDEYFYVDENNEVKVKPFADPSKGNAGVQFLAGIIASPRIYVLYVGTDADEAGSYFKDRDAAKREFNGTRRDRPRGQNAGSVVGSSGRPNVHQPGKLPTGEDVFFVLAINMNAVITQSSDLGQNLDVGGNGTPFNAEVVGALILGAGQRVQPISLFFHEGAENQKFEEIGFFQYSPIASHKADHYTMAHNYAKTREAAIRRELNISGGFAGGSVIRTVPH